MPSGDGGFRGGDEGGRRWTANEKLAVVVDQSPRSLLKPIVKVFYSLRHQERLPPQELDLSAPHTKVQILGREDPADWTFPDLNDIWSGGAAPVG